MLLSCIDVSFLSSFLSSLKAMKTKSPWLRIKIQKKQPFNAWAPTPDQLDLNCWGWWGAWDQDLFLFF